MGPRGQNRPYGALGRPRPFFFAQRGPMGAKIQRKSYIKSGAKRQKNFLRALFGQNTKEILYKIRREAPEKLIIISMPSKSMKMTSNSYRFGSKSMTMTSNSRRLGSKSMTMTSNSLRFGPKPMTMTSNSLRFGCISMTMPSNSSPLGWPLAIYNI